MSQACPYCREAIADQYLINCPACQTPHHRDCWEENGGCTIFGCEKAPSDEPKLAVTLPPEGASPTPPPLYLVYHNGKQLGPYPLDFITDQTASGVFLRTVLIWSKGMENWTPLVQLISPPPSPYAAPPQNQSHEQSVINHVPDDPCAGRHRFGRLAYVFSYIGFLIFTQVLAGIVIETTQGKPAGILGFFLILNFIVSVAVFILRAGDLGMKGWSLALAIVPFVNIYIGFLLLTAPRGYWITKKADSAMRVLCWIAAVFIALIIALIVIGALSSR